ncbi:hypothetical protein [Bordetella petrii]|uniref:hypothetical protein n=1 Tax=Bordetella petrii TaxID=94624 RepID=UPI001E654F10|nr:hypothetical protein [Bordetella petrii]MCD0504224.1 hypothetical protein [Bordetella petrii]
MKTPDSSDPWYREPWPWFLMAGPLLAILGCMITIYLAMTRYGDQAISDGGVKRGLVVERVQPAAAAPAPGLAESRPEPAQGRP